MEQPEEKPGRADENGLNPETSRDRPRRAQPSPRLWKVLQHCKRCCVKAFLLPLMYHLIFFLISILDSTHQSASWLGQCAGFQSVRDVYEHQAGNAGKRWWLPCMHWAQREPREADTDRMTSTFCEYIPRWFLNYGQTIWINIDFVIAQVSLWIISVLNWTKPALQQNRQLIFKLPYACKPPLFITMNRIRRLSSTAMMFEIILHDILSI